MFILGLFLFRGAERDMDGENNRRAGVSEQDKAKKPLRVNPVLITAAILVVSALASYRFVPALINSPSADKAKGKGSETARAVKYTCPMHPFINSDRPAACPICGMSLISQESSVAKGDASASEAHLTGGVSLSPTQRLLANVATTKVALDEFSIDTVAAGKVAWDERRQTRISARISGRIERLHANFTGARVGAGQPLLDIYSPDLVSSQKEYLLAIEGAERAKESPLADSRSMMGGLRDAARVRLKQWGVSDSQVAELSRTRQPKSVVTVYAPASGIVTERLVTAGQYVNEGAPLFSVAPLSTVWVHAELYETECGRVAVGAPAVVTTETWPGKEFRGKVAFVDPVINPETRTLKVRVDLANPGELLKPEMFVKVALKGRKVRALAVPEDAVVVTGDRALAWVESAPGTFEPRNVTLGRRGSGFYEVLSGLSAGEAVAASGGFLIDSESQLKSARSGAPEQLIGKGP